MKKKSWIIRTVSFFLLVSQALCTTAVLADTGYGQEKKEAAMQFIALQKNDASLARRTVAQKPPLRFFSKRGAPAPMKNKMAGVSPSVVHDSFLPNAAASSRGEKMTRQQAQLILSIFEEAR